MLCVMSQPLGRAITGDHCSVLGICPELIAVQGADAGTLPGNTVFLSKDFGRCSSQVYSLMLLW